ncbi:hypothetical protein KBX31_04110 [Liquorilactobacillus satsumensis]|uniref:hypothetical protein n=1 Tax=Liquorilactobacillus satsumensis TaxID=259059 RepID=UPI0021C3D363|nr:hypothetical protein [Liquorilactobacillus satsumensis]MCP9312484.1 hypothetical protein [Liquorilactobacillus satsumensis]MCP9329071.1 hypothetical protein [Liquorilactobacillus satsumensis]MCP9359774.1 hypothetical protein [Liquorilactobacillus satsumensis]
MKLLRNQKIEFEQQQLKTYQEFFEATGCLGWAPLLWQKLSLPKYLKNAAAYLLEEEVSLDSAKLVSNTALALELTLLNEHKTQHGKYIPTLELKIRQQEQLIGTVKLKLLTEESWNAARI